MFGIRPKIITDLEKIKEVLERGIDEVIEFEHLKTRLLKGDKLRVKLGIDPTAKDLHLGHTVVLKKLTSKFSLARALERDDFQKRIKNDQDVGLLEILYPLFQGYDSVAIQSDIEIGGTDQKFNLLTGRKVQRRYDQPEQDIITCPLIEGLDGVKKMSKSTGNYIGLSGSHIDMFGKIMSVPDGLMVKYFKLLTDLSEVEIENIKNDVLVNPSMAKKSPKEWKQTLAFELVKMYHGEKAAQKAKDEWENVFSKKELPEVIEEAPGEGMKLVDFITEHALATS